MDPLVDAATSTLTPAPGRTIVPLERGWTAVILRPIPGHPYAAVGFFHAGHLERLIDEPTAVQRLLRALGQSAA